jgi:colicin import membrane protein
MENAIAIEKFQDFSPAKIEGMVNEYLLISVPAESSKEYKAAREALTTCVSTRTGIDKRRKALNEDAKQWINSVNDTAKKLTAMIEPAESHLRQELQREDERKESIKKEKERIEQERISGIRKKIAVIQNMTTNLNGLSSQQLSDLAAGVSGFEITLQDYQELIQEADQVKQTALGAIQDALADRIKFEKEKEEQKIEAERLAKQKAKQEENERILKEEKAKLEAEKLSLLKAQEEAEKKIREEKAKIEAERMAEENRKTEEKRKAELAEKAKIKAEEDEKKRIEAEAAAKKAEEERLARIEALKPDKEKIKNWLNQILSIKPPDVVSTTAKELIDFAVKSFTGSASEISAKMDNM